MPFWIMEFLGIKEGGFVTVLQKELVKGTFVKIQPHSQTFLDIHNPQAVLEKHLRSFSAMTKGDVFTFKYNGTKFKFNVLEVKPANAVSIIETDINVDFAPPLDYEEPKPVKKEAPVIVPKQNVDLSDEGDSDEDSDEKEIKFPGGGMKLNGKPAILENGDSQKKKESGGLLLGASSSYQSEKKKEEEQKEKDNNWRAFSGEGFALKQKKNKK